MSTCYKCNTKLNLDPQNVTRSSICENCYTDIRCCHMCTFFDRNSYNECREPMADRITDKEKKNFCDYYSLGSNIDKEKEKEDLLNKANALFK